MKHTPGPWECFVIGDEVWVRQSSGREIFMGCARDHIEGSDDGWEYDLADAHLIAAAPDLLAALEAVMEWYPLLLDNVYPSDVNQEWEELTSARDAGFAALTKAKGKDT